MRYLVGALGDVPGVHLAGLYGMETVGADGAVHHPPGVEAWRPVVDEVTRAAMVGAPPGADVEGKGLSVTLHWRRAPEAEAWAVELAGRETARTGLVAQPGRMAIELRPPVHADKGTVVERLGRGHAVVACFGDDLGDLPAFAALARLEADGALVARVAVADAESPTELVAAADLVVEGPHEAVRLLRAVAGPDPDPVADPDPGPGPDPVADPGPGPGPGPGPDPDPGPNFDPGPDPDPGPRARARPAGDRYDRRT